MGDVGSGIQGNEDKQTLLSVPALDEYKQTLLSVSALD